MTGDNRPPPPLDYRVKCPLSTCDSEAAVVVVRSRTIVTFRCMKCTFVWSDQIAELSPLLRDQLREGLPVSG